MAAIDRIRRAASRARAVPARLGARQYTVTIRAEAFDRPRSDKAIELTPRDLTITPPPKVTKLTAAQASYYGAGPLAISGAPMLTAAIYRIGPITPRFGAGGYTIADMLPPSSVRGRSLVFMTGPDLSDDGDNFNVVDIDTTKSTGWYLTVQQVA